MSPELKRNVSILLVLSLALVGAIILTGCKTAGAVDHSKSTFTWEVYAADPKCECQVYTDKGWQAVTNLVVVEWGFVLADGTSPHQQELGAQTPWRKSQYGAPPRVIGLSLGAQSADPTVKLLCVLWLGKLLLGAYGAPAGKPGTCSALSDF